MPSISIGAAPTQSPAIFSPTDNVNDVDKGFGSSSPASAAIAVLVVLLFIGLLTGSVVVARKRARARRNNCIRTRRIERPQLWTIDGEKELEPPGYTSQESLLLKESGPGQTSLTGIPVLYEYDSADAAFPAPPPKAVTYAPKKRLGILSTAFMTQAPNESSRNSETNTPRTRITRHSQASLMSDMTTETWSRINLHSPTQDENNGHMYINATGADNAHGVVLAPEEPTLARSSSTQRATVMRQSSIRSQKALVYRAESARSNTAELTAPPWDPSLTIPGQQKPAENSQPLPLITLSPATPVTPYSFI